MGSPWKKLAVWTQKFFQSQLCLFWLWEWGGVAAVCWVPGLCKCVLNAQHLMHCPPGLGDFRQEVGSEDLAPAGEQYVGDCGWDFNPNQTPRALGHCLPGPAVCQAKPRA